jgi:acyl carrier protein
MVPAQVVALTRLPLTVNGKVDRAALPQPSADISHGPGRAPRTPAEKTLAEIWQAVLGISDVGIDDDLFEVGGDSLVAAEITSRIRERFDREVTLREMLREPTVAGLAAMIETPQGVS